MARDLLKGLVFCGIFTSLFLCFVIVGVVVVRHWMADSLKPQWEREAAAQADTPDREDDDLASKLTEEQRQQITQALGQAMNFGGARQPQEQPRDPREVDQQQRRQHHEEKGARRRQVPTDREPLSKEQMDKAQAALKDMMAQKQAKQAQEQQ